MFSAAALLFTLAQTPQPLTDFEKQFLAVEDVVTVTDGSSSREQVFSQGKYKQPLSTEEFLRAVGRAEEADNRLTRQMHARLLTFGSLVSVLVGVVATAMSVGDSQPSCGSPMDPSFSRCVQNMVRHPPGPAEMGPFIMGATVGAVLFTSAITVYPSPPDPVQMRRLADEHNQALRLRLSVSGRF